MHRKGFKHLSESTLRTVVSALMLSAAICFVHSNVNAQDISALGGDMTSDLSNQNAIQVTTPNISSEERRLAQLDGFSVFHRIVSREEGLGPLFNHHSCGACHVNNGRGALEVSSSPNSGSSLLLKVALRGFNNDRSPRDVPRVGEQIRDHAVGGAKKRARFLLRWATTSNTYPDGTPFELRRPVISVRINGRPRKDVVTSLRMTPPIIGPGLLESIAESTILELSDPDDINNDGISGRPQYVIDKKTGLYSLGRFGFRASHPTVEQQSAAAAFNDMGVTSSIFPGTSGTPELSDADLALLVIYQQLGGVPRARNQDDPAVVAGKALFQQVGCDSCHRMNIVTSPDASPETRNQTIHPFTDLLLHDMGAGLADKRSEFSASGREWRTTPLWGLGFSPNISNVKLRLLHDGRARSVEEAILWHGGEALASRNAFMNLSKSERESLLSFLNSL